MAFAFLPISGGAANNSTTLTAIKATANEYGRSHGQNATVTNNQMLQCDRHQDRLAANN